MKSIFSFILVFILFTGFAQQKVDKKDLDRLAGYMSGSFSSEKQHEADTGNYYNIRLKMIQIWNTDKDGYWFYVEQVVDGKEDKPYRQRVYHVSILNDSIIESKIYLLRNPLQYATKQSNSILSGNISKDSLVYKNGCDVYLKKNGTDFVGGTVGNGCESLLRGASYATTEVTIQKDLLTSWDRGYDKEKKQAWGATKGDYHFEKKEIYTLK